MRLKATGNPSYLLTDGRPTDDTTAEVKRWKDHYASKVNLIAVGWGRQRT